LGELYAGNQQSFPNVVDPTGAPTEPQVEQRFSGNPDLQPETAYEWTYGAVITPGKWWSALQGLTVSADFFHIDLRSVSLALDSQFLIDHESQFPGQVIRDPDDNRIILLLTPNQNLGRLIMEGYDFEFSYVFETARLGGGDWGTFTAIYNHSYIDRAVVQFVPGGQEQIVVGKFGGGFLGEQGGGAFTHNRSYGSLFYNGPTGTWAQGLDTGVTIHYIGQYWDSRGFTSDGNDRKIREWITTDWLLNYTFNLPPPVAQTEVAGYAKDGGKNVRMGGKDKAMPVSTAAYNPCGWRYFLDQTTITLGMNNVFDLRPPFVAAAFENGYDQETASNRGRLWFVGIKKKF
jgi:outer membrane receptor protein involved in Fe transport